MHLLLDLITLLGICSFPCHGQHKCRQNKSNGTLGQFPGPELAVNCVSDSETNRSQTRCGMVFQQGKEKAIYQCVREENSNDFGPIDTCKQWDKFAKYPACIPTEEAKCFFCMCTGEECDPNLLCDPSKPDCRCDVSKADCGFTTPGSNSGNGLAPKPWMMAVTIVIGFMGVG